MYRQRRVMRHPLALGLLVALVILALSACGGGSARAQHQQSKSRPLPEDMKALRPGTYRSEEFKPPFSIRVGKGSTISLNPQITSRHYEFIGDSSARALLAARG